MNVEHKTGRKMCIKTRPAWTNDQQTFVRVLKTTFLSEVGSGILHSIINLVSDLKVKAVHARKSNTHNFLFVLTKVHAVIATASVC